MHTYVSIFNRKVGMKKLVAICILAIIVIGVISLVHYQQTPDVLRHEAARWAVIEDYNNDRIAVEPLNDESWSQLVQLYQNGSREWVGGIVETYDNSWGFRFKPESITVAEVTAEGLQGTIRYISENLNQWLNGWAYVSAKITEIHPA